MITGTTIKKETVDDELAELEAMAEHMIENNQEVNVENTDSKYCFIIVIVIVIILVDSFHLFQELR